MAIEIALDPGLTGLIGALIGGGFSLAGTLVAARIARRDEDKRQLRAAVSDFLDLLADYGSQPLRDQSWVVARNKVAASAQKMMLLVRKDSRHIQVVIGRTLDLLDAPSKSKVRLHAINALAYVVAEWHKGRVRSKNAPAEYAKVLRRLAAEGSPSRGAE